LDTNNELNRFISVDIETSGPNPGEYSILSIGACTLVKEQRTFYIELKPTTDNYIDEALSVSGLSFKLLYEDGELPKKAMQKFRDWLKDIKKPIFVAFNAVFDWMFINEYFHRYLWMNPFGHSALDIKSFYMGKKNVSWEQTSMKRMLINRQPLSSLSHNALEDALAQATIFLDLLKE